MLSRINKLKNYILDCETISVYDYNGESIQELLCQFYTKINSCVDVTNKGLDILEYLMSNGINEEVAKELSKLVENMDLTVLVEELTHNRVIGSVNLLDFDDKTGYWDEPLRLALSKGKMVYIPSRSESYKIKSTLFDLSDNNIIFGDNKKQSIIEYVGSENTSTGDYIFKLANNTGFKNIGIHFKNDFSGRAIYIDSSLEKLDRKDYTLENVDVMFNWGSGYGIGLDIRVKNFDDNGNVYTDNRPCSVVYFNVLGCEFSNAQKGLSITLNQKDPIQMKPWITASTFTNCLFNRCCDNIFMQSVNNSSEKLLDFKDIKFVNCEVQLAESNFFRSNPTKINAINSIGNQDDWRIGLNFTNFSIWDSETGYQGNLINTEAQFYNVMFTRYTNDQNHRYGFYNKNSIIGVDNDITSRYYYSNSGAETVVSNIDNGFYVLDTPEEKGYNPKFEFTHTQTVKGSETKFDNKDKNGILENSIVMNYDTLDLIHSDSNDNVKVATYGYRNTISNNQNSEQAFMSGNGMAIINKIVKESQIPTGISTFTYQIDSSYKFFPFVLGCTRRYTDGYQTQVDILQCQVLSSKVIELIVKNNGSSPIDVEFSITTCGYTGENKL